VLLAFGTFTYHKPRKPLYELEKSETERKQPDEEKVKAKTYLESSLSSSSDAVLLLDKQARSSYMNPTFLKWLDPEEKDFIGKTIKMNGENLRVCGAL
jgi:PAS domain-containing protein